MIILFSGSIRKGIRTPVLHSKRKISCLMRILMERGRRGQEWNLRGYLAMRRLLYVYLTNTRVIGGYLQQTK